MWNSAVTGRSRVQIRPFAFSDFEFVCDLNRSRTYANAKGKAMRSYSGKNEYVFFYV